MSEHIHVQTISKDSYAIHIGRNLMGELVDYIASSYGTEKILLIIDQNVHKYHNSRIEGAFEETFNKVLTYIVPPGELSKSLNQYARIIDFILNEGVERGTPMVAFGGGVVGDLTGFVASSVLRGLPLIQVPTTLLAMVDSSIGGKTGVNHDTGKNLIGAFYQPKAVFADVEFLESLPQKEWVNGLSEILKYALIEQPALLEELSMLTHHNSFSPSEEWSSVIRKSAEIKVDIVQRDVKEGGIRAFLNFGHTFAHVLERIGNYEEFSHGEAVFAGMFAAVKASNLLGIGVVSEALLEPFVPLYSIHLANVKETPEELTNLMLLDKKVKGGAIRLVLLEEPGKPVVQSVEDLAPIYHSWSYILDKFK